MQLIGAGFGRTGTLSLKGALEEVGFGPCYHMMEVFKQPEDLVQWAAVAKGQVINWREFFQAYQATVDWPGAAVWTQLHGTFPEAKVLLSVRDPVRWYESALNTIHESTQGTVNPLFKQMVDYLIWNGTFHGKFLDQAYAIGVFEAHIAHVKATVPPEQLLVYDVKEGWAPLCAFLGVPVPETPSPRLNDREAFKQRTFNS